MRVTIGSTSVLRMLLMGALVGSWAAAPPPAVNLLRENAFEGKRVLVTGIQRVCCLFSAAKGALTAWLLCPRSPTQC